MGPNVGVNVRIKQQQIGNELKYGVFDEKKMILKIKNLTETVYAKNLKSIHKMLSYDLHEFYVK